MLVGRWGCGDAAAGPPAPGWMTTCRRSLPPDAISVCGISLGHHRQQAFQATVPAQTLPLLQVGRCAEFKVAQKPTPQVSRLGETGTSWPRPLTVLSWVSACGRLVEGSRKACGTVHTNGGTCVPVSVHNRPLKRTRRPRTTGKGGSIAWISS